MVTLKSLLSFMRDAHRKTRRARSFELLVGGDDFAALVNEVMSDCGPQADVQPGELRLFGNLTVKAINGIAPVRRVLDDDGRLLWSDPPEPRMVQLDHAYSMWNHVIDDEPDAFIVVPPKPLFKWDPRWRHQRRIRSEAKRKEGLILNKPISACCIELQAWVLGHRRCFVGWCEHGFVPFHGDLALARMVWEQQHGGPK